MPKQKKYRPTYGTIQFRSGAFHHLWYQDGKKVSRRVADAINPATGRQWSDKQLVEHVNELIARGAARLPGHASNLPRSVAIPLTPIAENWLDHCRKHKRKSTADGYEQVHYAHLESHFGEKKAYEYETHDARQFLKSLYEGGKHNPTTIAHIRTVLSAIFTHAITEMSLPLKGHPIAALGKLKYKAKRAGTLPQDQPRYTTEETAAVLRALNSEDTAVEHAIMSLALRNGIQPAEIAGMMWKDLDLQEGTFTITRTASRGRANADGEAKNAHRLATVPLGAATVASLERVKRLQPVSIKGYVFQTATGNPHDLSSFCRRVIRPSLKERGVTIWKGLYSGRRATGTELGRYSNAQAVAGYLRNSPAVAAKYYMGRLPDEAMKAQAAYDSAIDAAFSSTSVADSSQTEVEHALEPHKT